MKTILFSFKDYEDEIDIDFNDCDSADLLRATFAIIETLSINSTLDCVQISERLAQHFRNKDEEK